MTSTLSSVSAATGKKIVHVAGYSSCGFYRRAASVVASLSLLFPSRLQLVEHEFPTREAYRDWLIHEDNFREKAAAILGGTSSGASSGASSGTSSGASSGTRARNHATSPFCWLACGKELLAEEVTHFIGGNDDLMSWCRVLCAELPQQPSQQPSQQLSQQASLEATMAPDGHSADHSYDYDLVVIGGGSGGLAASKEAAALGARVAVLDFVKPSPQGTSWGLGGTCVNVGCIPKKLMHQGALLNLSARLDAPHFGLDTLEPPPMSEDAPPRPHSWETLTTNVQNHVRGLNFKYRVDLRTNNVTYLNKLATFRDPHTLTTTDKNGNQQLITASRFLIAVGGRPTPLSCEGAHLAISSDDIFSLQQDPGKVLCVGASYISLECAGFLHGIGKDVTVAVRSILLRGFDRECADQIGDYMKTEGIRFREHVVPTKLEKIDGKIKVTFSDGDSDTYDTVLAAIGRTGDTASLGLQHVNVQTNPKNSKIYAKFEQTSTPNIYVVGDVMDGCPELTPVAIQAGKSLSKRLFGQSTAPMDYHNVCTTVFTPIEYSTVGYSEEDATDRFPDDVEIYHKFFVPLEWAISPTRGSHSGFTKAIVQKSTDRILGLHYLGPNAGEVMQGFGTAMKKGMTFHDLVETVGIHPTTAEEITTLSITKSSGMDAAASGC